MNGMNTADAALVLELEHFCVEYAAYECTRIVERLTKFVSERRSCTQRAGGVWIAGGQAEVDPFFIKFLAGWMQSLERAQPHLKTAVCHLRSTVPALSRSATPALKHTINVVAN